MGNNLSSKRVKNHDSGLERGHLYCKICSKPLPNEYFEVTSKKPAGKFNVCSNDCEAVIWESTIRIISN